VVANRLDPRRRRLADEAHRFANAHSQRRPENLSRTCCTTFHCRGVIREPEAVIAVRDLPQLCVSDNGPKFTGSDHTCAGKLTDRRHCIDLAKPQQNAFAERFNGRLCDGLLNKTLLTFLGRTRVDLE
jgi:hypothetical protein